MVIFKILEDSYIPIREVNFCSEVLYESAFARPRQVGAAVPA